MAKNPEEQRAADRARYAANPEKKKASSRAWRAKHPEEHRAHNKAYREAHPDQVRAAKAAYAKANPEKIRDGHARFKAAHPERIQAIQKKYSTTHPENGRKSAANYRKAHPEKIHAYLLAHPEIHVAVEARRRAQKKRSPINDFTAAQWKEMQAAYDHRCAYCGKRTKGHLTIDHITPLSKGGPHTASNIVPACRQCNSKKFTGAPLCPVQPLLLTISPSKKKHGKQ